MHLCFLLALVLVLLQLSLSRLIFAYEHFRHGARGPSDNLKGNKDFLNIQWDTLGEITGVGLRMHLVIGFRNRLRYANFLSKTYDQREILIISTPLNRTIESALAQAQGLYPPSTGLSLSQKQISNSFPPINKTDEVQKFIDSLGSNALPSLMSAITVRTFDLSKHTFLLHEANYHGGGCPPVGKIRIENGQKDNIREETLKFNATYGEKIMKYFNTTDSSLCTEFPFINRFCDHYIANYHENHDLSSLERVGIDLDLFEFDCLDILNLGMFEYILGDPHEKVAMMSMTYPFKDLLHYMNQRIALDLQGKTDELSYQAPRFVMISGHDSSVAAMEIYMNETFGTTTKNPIFAANVVFEVHRNDSNLKKDKSDYYVEYYIHDDLIRRFPFIEFENSISKNFWTPEAINTFCNFTQVVDPATKPNKEGTYLIVIYALVGTTVLFIILFIIAVICYRRKEVFDIKALDQLKHFDDTILSELGEK